MTPDQISEKKKKITFSVNGLMYGGVARNTINLANEMAHMGHDVSIAILGAESDLVSEVNDLVKVIFFKPTLRKSFLPFVFYLIRRRPDLLIAAKDHVNLVSILAHRLSLISGKCIITIRTTLSEQMKHKSSKIFRRSMYFARYLYPLADRIVAVSNGAARDAENFLGLPSHSIETIYNPAAKPTAFNQEYPLPDHPFFHINNNSNIIPVLLACGRFHKQKNFDALIHAFAIARQTIDARLIILGDGKDKEKLEKIVKNSELIEFISLTANVLVPERFMYHADLFVLSSRWEGFSNVIVEALSTGCPVLSTDCPHGPAEILENGKFGRLVPNNAPDDLGKAIVEELQNKEKTITRDIRIKRAQNFTPDIIATQYLE